ncbi:MAG: DUF3501 family protein [Alphaproteobacteria bacterium]|nr:DUF3501 family protein [Alphaproteobacteria bacterium]
MTPKRLITRADILPMAEYAAERRQRRADVIALKRARRIAVGPFATFHFETYETMWQQIHEMLYIEKGGEQQIEDELAAYNPLIPQGSELVATMMLEIEDPVRRAATLATLGGIEDMIALEIDGERVAAVPEHDVERTKADGKTSSVHFLRFPFTRAQIEAFRDPARRVMLSIGHPNYGHIAVLSPENRAALARDFD